MSTLVLGVGNVLLTDEGVGVRALKELERRFSFSDDVELLDGGTSGIELLRHIQGRDNLIIIDCMTFDQPPGTVYKVENEDVPAAFRTRISPHQLGLSDLLAALMLTDGLPENLVLFGVEPESIDIGLELTTTVESSLDKLITAIAEELRRIGCSVVPHKTSFSDKACFWKTANVPLNT
ncbi:MAG: HyaD/HybD family hydrogenase maturation endopeptidase [Deltaproteobacteria bacterium]|nr:HyaD/HybD family hydrogenase maturation endopeptidase [Deltaproteobacteria bacterium]